MLKQEQRGGGRNDEGAERRANWEGELQGGGEMKRGVDTRRLCGARRDEEERDKLTNREEGTKCSLSLSIGKPFKVKLAWRISGQTEWPPPAHPNFITEGWFHFIYSKSPTAFRTFNICQLYTNISLKRCNVIITSSFLKQRWQKWFKLYF